MSELDLLNQLTIVAQNIDFSPLPNARATPERLQDIMTVIFTITGAISIVMIVIGGIKYSSSMGDSQGVAKAKGTVIYAIVGLVISILSVSIVGFTLGRVG